MFGWFWERKNNESKCFMTKRKDLVWFFLHYFLPILVITNSQALASFLLSYDSYQPVRVRTSTCSQPQNLFQAAALTSSQGSWTLSEETANCIWVHRWPWLANVTQHAREQCHATLEPSQIYCLGLSTLTYGCGITEVWTCSLLRDLVLVKGVAEGQWVNGGQSQVKSALGMNVSLWVWRLLGLTTVPSYVWCGAWMPPMQWLLLEYPLAEPSSETSVNLWSDPGKEPHCAALAPYTA